MQEKNRQDKLKNKLRKKLSNETKQVLDFTQEIQEKGRSDRVDAAAIQVAKEIILNPQSKINSSLLSTSTGGFKELINAEKSIDLKKEAESLLIAGLSLLTQNDFTHGTRKLTDAILKAEKCHAGDIAFLARKVMISLALGSGDLVTASMLAASLDEFCTRESFAIMSDSACSKLLGFKLNERDFSDSYLSLSLCFMLLGNLEKSITYFRKITHIELPRQEQHSNLEQVIKILSPFYEELKTKRKMTKNLEDLSAILTLNKQQSIHFINNLQYQEFYELLKQLILLSAYFDSNNNFKMDSALTRHYSDLKSHIMEIKFHLADSLYQKYKTYDQNKVNDNEKKTLDRYRQIFIYLLKEVLTYATNNKNHYFIFLTSGLLAEYYASQLPEFDLDSEPYNSVLAKYTEYFSIRNEAASTLDNEKPKIAKENLSKKDENSATTFHSANNSEQENSSEVPEYEEWQHAYNLVASTITTDDPDTVLQKFKSLLDKYSLAQRQAQIHFGIAECHYFDSKNVKKVINALEKDLQDLSEINEDYKQKLWKRLERDYGSIEASLNGIIDRLELAIHHLNLVTQQCKTLVDNNDKLSPQENDDIKKILNSSQILISNVHSYSNQIHKVIKGFIKEMAQKKELLISLDLYGKSNKNKCTGLLVKSSILQDTKLNALLKHSDTIKKTASDLESSATIKSKSLGLWYKKLAEDEIKNNEYDCAYDYYSKAKIEFKKDPKFTAFYGTVETKLAWLKAVKVDLTQDIQLKRELTLQSLEHSKLALIAFQSTQNPSFAKNYDKQIEEIKTDIAKKQNFLNQLDETVLKVKTNSG